MIKRLSGNRDKIKEALRQTVHQNIELIIPKERIALASKDVSKSSQSEQMQIDVE